MLVALGGAILVGIWTWSSRKLEARRRDLEQRLTERDVLLDRATRDGLTRLWNRHTILEVLAGQIDIARNSSTPLAVAMIDVDHFKRINDTMGHLTGDEVLHTLGEQLSKSTRLWFAGTLWRRGVAPDASQCDAESACATHRASETDTTENLLSRADCALYAAKQAGRNRVVYDSMATSA